MIFFEPLKEELMVQQQVNNSWEHMVGVIMLNQTNRKIVKSVLPEFLYWFPDSNALIRADEEFVKSILAPLGLTNVRYKRILQMSNDYISWDGDDASKLYGIGKYGSDSYEIFFKNNLSVKPSDKELLKYLEETQ